MTRPAPDFIRNQTHFDGERIIGWRIIVKQDPHVDMTKPAGSPESRRTYDAGYLLVTESGIYEFDINEMGTRASSLHPTDYEYPERA